MNTWRWTLTRNWTLPAFRTTLLRWELRSCSKQPGKWWSVRKPTRLVGCSARERYNIRKLPKHSCRSHCAQSRCILYYWNQTSSLGENSEFGDVSSIVLLYSSKMFQYLTLEQAHKVNKRRVMIKARSTNTKARTPVMMMSAMPQPSHISFGVGFKNALHKSADDEMDTPSFLEEVQTLVCLMGPHFRKMSHDTGELYSKQLMSKVQVSLNITICRAYTDHMCWSLQCKCLICCWWLLITLSHHVEQ